MAPKRKRAGTLSKDTPADTIQPSSRDASGEDTADPVLEDVKERKSMDPPAKRSRSTRSDANAKKSESSSSAVSNGHVRRPSSSAQMPANAFQEGGGENGEAGDNMRMPPPPPAGAVDPVGYHTNPPPKDRPVRVYADGVFDLFHLGHMRVLQQAKTAFPDTWLIVGVTGDTETHKRKGLTVMSGKERAESLRHCRWVDEVIEDCPWIINVDFLLKHEIDYVAHDDLPYGASEGDDIYKPIKEKGMFLVTQRTEGVSTTGIITKIVRDYEKYVSRQLKRGSSRQELNISWLKKNELDMKRHVSELRDTIRTNWTTTGQELSRDLKQFWTPSRPNSPAPSLRNGTPGRGSGAKSPLGRGRNDFAAGYAMGLIGGVKSWMEGSRRKNLSDSRGQSPGGDEEDSEESSGGEGPSRGRAGKIEDDGKDAREEKMDVEV
jgi:choline-phosphate cytidylyltransferase